MDNNTALERIKDDIGAPVLSIPEITNEFISRNFIDRALAYYFRCYPLKSEKTYAAGTILNYTDLPSNFLGIIANNFISYFEYPGQIYTDPFTMARGLVSIDKSIYRMLPDNIMLRFTGVSAARPSFAIVNDEAEKKIKFISLYQGFFNVTFALRGTIVDVRPNDEWDFIEYAAAYLKRYLYRTRMSLDISMLPIKLNFDLFKSEADESIKKIEEKWKPYNFILVWS